MALTALDRPPGLRPVRQSGRNSGLDEALIDHAVPLYWPLLTQKVESQPHSPEV